MALIPTVSRCPAQAHSPSRQWVLFIKFLVNVPSIRVRWNFVMRRSSQKKEHWSMMKFTLRVITRHQTNAISVDCRKVWLWIWWFPKSGANTASDKIHTRLILPQLISFLTQGVYWYGIHDCNKPCLRGIVHNLFVWLTHWRMCLLWGLSQPKGQ